jgi:hypothetical protein
VLAVIVGEVVPDGGIFRVKLLGVFVLQVRALLVAGVVEETAVGEEAVRAFGMALEKILIRAAHLVEARLDARVQRRGGRRRLVGVGLRIIFAEPAVHVVLRGVVGQHHLAQFLFRRRRGDVHGHAGLLLDDIAHGLRLVGGQQRAEESDGEFVHAEKITLRL